MKETNTGKPEMAAKSGSDKPDRDAKSADRKPEMAAASKGIAVEGTVKSFDDGKGFGFITQDGATKEVYVNQEAITGDGNRIVTGDRVSFEVTEGPKGPRANMVHKL